MWYTVWSAVVNALIVPPDDSISPAMAPTGRLGVPLNSMCSCTCAAPAMSGVSSALPALTHICTATTGAKRSS